MASTSGFAAPPPPSDAAASSWSERLTVRSSARLLRTIGFATAAFLAWATFFQLDQVTRATGRVAPSEGAQVIQHLEGGIVSDIRVREGERVRRGDVLVRLSNQFSSADLSNAQTEVAAMKITLSRLEAEISGTVSFAVDPGLAAIAPAIAATESELFASRQAELRQDVSVADAQVQNVQAELASLDARLASLRAEERGLAEQLRMMDRALAADAIGGQEVMDKRNALQQLRTRISDVVTEIPQARARAAEAAARRLSARAKFVAEAGQKASEVRLALAKAEQGLSAFSDRQKRTDVRAPVDGVVNRVYVRTIGGVVRGGDPIMEITPVDSTVTIEARLDPKDRADVWPGQTATVKISAFDSGSHGGLDARIVDISPDAIPDERGQSYFRVRLVADAAKLGPKFAVTPGMNANVDIRTGRRTILDYLLAPVEKVSRSALRE